MFLSDTILSDHKNCVTAIISEDIVMFLFAGNLLSSTISSCKRELLIHSEALCQKLRIIMLSRNGHYVLKTIDVILLELFCDQMI